MEKLLKQIKFYKGTRQLTEMLCQALELEDYISQPIENVSPPKWHLGHTTWFFEALILKKYNRKYKVFNEKFFFLFNSYYNSLGDRANRNERGNQTRPTVKQIYEYRSYVDYELSKFLESNPDDQVNLIELLELGINHEKQHQELLVTDIKYILFQNPSMPSYCTFDEKLLKENSIKKYTTIDEGLYEIGYNGPDFYFDNESGIHKVFLHSFKYENQQVTNKEFIEFIESGGYQDFRHWLSDGWTWVNDNNITCPLYWKKNDNEWFYYTLGGFRKVDLNLPVTHISFYEADAFASWAKKRLMTEFEWETVAKQKIENIKTVNCLEQKIYTPVATSNVLMGNVWEWTNSAYLAYPYFKKFEGPVAEYNGKFMANQMVLRGGSCVTASTQIRVTYRNFFHLHERWQFTGLRLAENN